MGRSASEEVVLNLIKVKCLPVLLYGTEACPLNLTGMRSFEFALKRVMIKLYFVPVIIVYLAVPCLFMPPPNVVYMTGGMLFLSCSSVPACVRVHVSKQGSFVHPLRGVITPNFRTTPRIPLLIPP